MGWMPEGINTVVRVAEREAMNVGLIFFAITLILQPIAQILEKTGMNMVGAVNGLQGGTGLFSKAWMIATNPYVICGVSVQVISLTCWLVALSHFRVSYLYPFGAISYIVLALLSYMILGETISTVRWFGIATIVIGAFLLNL